jgi:tryptophan synthase alpha subunit
VCTENQISIVILPERSGDLNLALVLSFEFGFSDPVHDGATISKTSLVNGHETRPVGSLQFVHITESHIKYINV